MAWRSKKYKKAKEEIEKEVYLIEEAVPLLQKISYTKFDETIEMIFRLGVNPKHADQMVRGTIVLPHGTGKSKRIAVIASGEKMKDAEDAGAERRHRGAQERPGRNVRGRGLPDLHDR